MSTVSPCLLLLPLLLLLTLMPSALHLLLVSVAPMVTSLRMLFCPLSLTIQVVWGKKRGLCAEVPAAG